MTIASVEAFVFHVRVMASTSPTHLVMRCHPRWALRSAALAAAALLGACHGEDPVIPPEPDPAAWADYLGDGGGLADGSLSDGPPPEVCTAGQGEATRLRVVNSTPAPVVMWWVDYACGERRYQVVPPGEFRDQESFVEHVWRLRTEDGELLRTVTLSETPTEVIEL